jgi:7,8-dihydropterin-6-yl-methyl-4-(beta-D-ribofuranosyl)aminobenzene 5'-phosphate synthase
MKQHAMIMFSIILCSMTACYPVRKLPVQSAAPTTILPTATIAPVAIAATPVPMTESSPTPVSTISPQPATDIPEETRESIVPVTHAITITIVYDNHISDQRLGSAWGFSALVEYGNNTLLFDTGGDGQLLLGNMRILGIDPLKIDCVVLSHIHDDHTGGLIALLQAGARPVVYLLPSFPASFKHQVEQYSEISEVSPGQALGKGIWTTGEIAGPIPEQSLVIETTGGLIVITGCAHPGIINILQRVHEANTTPLHLVLGGFHLGSKSVAEIEAIVNDFRSLGVEQVAPCHCTGDQAISLFAAEYTQDFLPLGVGSVLKFEALASK